MEKKGLVKRILVLFLGLFIMAFGVALSIKANLGTSPISSAPFVYSLSFPVSMGVLTIIMHAAFILLQMLILRKEYHPIQLLQLPVALLFGVFTDLTLSLVSARAYVANYHLQWLLCLASAVIIAFGVFLEVKAKVTYLAGEGLILAISKAFKLEFGKVKIFFDITLVLIAIASSFAFLHSLQGVREGTVASALLVGSFVRLFNKKLRFVDSLLGDTGSRETVRTRTSDGPARFVITIGREYGSGGHEIGKRVARELGISFYDSKLIDLSAAASGLTPEYIEANEQKLASGLLYDLYEQNYAFVNEEKPPLDTLFLVQSKMIRDIAQRESCVLVGRCAEFVLKGQPHCFSVFIRAPRANRIRRLVDTYGLAHDTAEKEMEKKDRERSNYCRHYTRKTWGAPENYSLLIDSSFFGLEKAARIIAYSAASDLRNRTA